ncbi:MAG TPA: family 20 glycosylhydrolase [Thermoanaerobaculia bacterium]|nr:family 20 glycosylhydrolase [Thermoanaerobaculia bacterium]
MRPETAYELLVPRPRDGGPRAGEWRPGGAVAMAVEGDGAVVRRAAARLAEALEERRVEVARDGARGLVSPAAALRLRVDAAAGLPAEGSRLAVAPAGVDLVAADAAGLFHGVSTLLQWLRLAAAGDGADFTVPALAVDDAPGLRVRGVMLDLARDAVPSMETLLATIDLLAGLKVNQLQLYLEHTFAYRGHEEVWRGASPLLPDEARFLDGYCAERAIELVPNQNSFGHFHRWLVHDRYRPLAECPEGIEHPFALEPEPFSLCAVDPRVPELLADLYDQLLPCFASRQANVGLDESFDLGRCRSRAASEERGRHRVYTEFVRTVHGLLAERGRRMQMWGDVVLEEPAVIGELPEDVLALVWGYEAGHPFVEQGERFRAAGLDFVLCPGTSGWTSLTGRTTNAAANLAEAAAAARDTGAAGVLVTDWGDYGHLQPEPTKWPGLLAGAAAAWNPVAPIGRHELPARLDAHVFRDAAGRVGRAVCDLGDTYRVAGGGNLNGAAYVRLLLFPGRDLDHVAFRSWTRESLEAAIEHLKGSIAPLTGARLERSDGAQVIAELHWSADAVAFACRFGLARLAAGRQTPVEALPADERSRFLHDLANLVARRRALWLARNRPGGLDHALSFLEPLARKLAGA